MCSSYITNRSKLFSIYSRFFLLLLSEIVVLWSPFKISVQSWTSLWRGDITKLLTKFRIWIGFSVRWIPSFEISGLVTGASNGIEFLFFNSGMTCSFVVLSKNVMPGKTKPPSFITLFANVDSSSLIYRTASSTTSIYKLESDRN